MVISQNICGIGRKVFLELRKYNRKLENEKEYQSYSYALSTT